MFPSGGIHRLQFNILRSMENYRKTFHTTNDCKYHIVWITKYRKKVLGGLVGEWVRELLRGICKENNVEILRGHVLKLTFGKF